MAFYWCEYMGGFASTKANDWTPAGVNATHTSTMANCTIGDTPIANVTSSKLPITWQITPRLKLTLTDNSGSMVYTFYDENNNVLYSYNDWIGTDYNRYLMGFAIDDVLQKGLFMLGQYRPGSSTVDWYARPVTDAQAQILYPYFVEGIQPPVVYQWSSVPAISGKNGILSLPVLIDTDGNPVSNGSASDFSTLPDSVKVRTLADLAVQ